MSRLDAALGLAARGFKVLPLHGMRPGAGGRLFCTCGLANCANPGKHPIAALVPRGLSNASAFPNVVRHWFTRAPHANIGLATGPVIALDVDPRHGGDESLSALEGEHGATPSTWRALTGGGGEHIFFTLPDGVEIRNSAGLLGSGLDVRGAGGYVVAPSSLHASGKTYEWSVDHHPDEVPIALMPAWMVEALTRPRSGPARAPQDWRRFVGEGATNGTRNDSVTRLTGHLLRRYVDPGVALELVQAWNATRCVPPLDTDEVTKIVNSIARKELQRREVRDGRR